MLIEICDDVALKVEQNDKVACEVIEQLSLAYKFKKHIIYASFPTIHRLTRVSYLSKSTRKIYSDIKKTLATANTLYQKIDFKTQITFKGTTQRTNKRIVFVPSQNSNFEFYKETHLLAENLNDCTFFNYLVEYYKRQNKIKCGFKYYSLPGGGNTIQDSYKNIGEKKQHFCLAIMDSDLKYPGGKLGDTCKGVLRIDRRQPSFNCSSYVMNNVMEIENLIPMHLISLQEKYKNKPMFTIPLTFDASFFDMKEGLLPEKLKDERLYNYWRNKLSSYLNCVQDLDNCRECIMILSPSPKENCQKECKKKIVEGFGTDLLDSTLENNEAKIKLSNIMPSHLTDSQKIEWYNIGKLILEWCCAVG